MIKIFDLTLSKYVNDFSFDEPVVIHDRNVSVVEVVKSYRIEIENENFSNLHIVVENENYTGASVWIKKTNETEWKKRIVLGSVVNNATFEIDVKLAVLNNKFLVRVGKYRFNINFYDVG
ncbi:MAG: hypothetical protein QXX12_05485 [Nanopusillaceae archaeon]